MGNKAALAILVASLGYFVDAYDVVLFSVVRVASLQSLGISEGDLLSEGARLLNFQMAGTLLGGLLWGVLGDKVGRMKALFGSILLYSFANIANAYVTNVDQYAVCRFIGGFGLAGEFGASVTLISEVMPRLRRGLGIGVLASSGILGCIAASLVAGMWSWTTNYLIGGTMGLALLVLRATVAESGMFTAMKNHAVVSGDFRLLFRSRDNVMRYVLCVLFGLPIWFILGIVVTFGPEIAKAIGIVGEIKSAPSFLWLFVAYAVGDVSMAMLSQVLRSRRWPVILCHTGTILGLIVLFYAGRGQPAPFFYVICAVVGFFAGFSSVFGAIIAEQFGTNLRATAATSIQNLVRGSTLVTLPIFAALKGHFDAAQSAQIVGSVVMALALFGIIRLKETFGDDLSFAETRDGNVMLPKKDG